MSVCIFAIFGYSNFKSSSSHRKWFTGAYLTGWHVKGYSSWSDSCFTIGVGWSSSFASAGLSKTYYSLLAKFLVIYPTCIMLYLIKLKTRINWCRKGAYMKGKVMILYGKVLITLSIISLLICVLISIYGNLYPKCL